MRRCPCREQSEGLRVVRMTSGLVKGNVDSGAIIEILGACHIIYCLTSQDRSCLSYDWWHAVGTAAAAAATGSLRVERNWMPTRRSACSDYVSMCTLDPFCRTFHVSYVDRPLQELPVLTKELLQEQFEAVVTDPVVRHDAVAEHVRSITGAEQFLGRYIVTATSVRPKPLLFYSTAPNGRRSSLPFRPLRKPCRFAVGRLTPPQDCDRGLVYTPGAYRRV